MIAMFNLDFWLLVFSTILVIVLVIYLLKQQQHNQLTDIFILDLIFTLIISIGVICQSFFSYFFNVPEILFENIIYIGTCFLPVSVFFTVSIFVNKKINFRKSYLLLLIVPILSLIVLWTNNIHNLFYIKYSASFTDTIYGPYFYIHTIYSYALLLIGVGRLLIFSIKNSGFFSKQSILICCGLACPVIVNVLGSFLKVIPMTVYATPIAFSISVICFALAIFKFDFLNVAPIALQKIVDRMSDSYIVLNENNIITDFNETFLTTFHLKSIDIRNSDFFELVASSEPTKTDKLVLTLEKAKHSSETFTFEKHYSKLNKYFNIEINSITNNGNFLGILILFKDITQHKIDMQSIREKQDLLIEKERLASLGQLVGGIAHNLKTPIMSIAGAAEGLTDLVKEYDSSIGDPEVNEQDHHEIANDMNEWIEKIKTHAAYMSDIITAVKGQAVTLNEQEQDSFTIQELIKRVTILMKHELKNALIDLNIHINTDEMTILNGNVNSLVQVINNMVSNSIQAYNGKTNQAIDLTVNKENSKIIISVKDYGSGMNDEVKEKLFKEMFTTKGKNGTGLGMFMSYSTIRGHFNGNITFDSEVGKGTTFYITLPL
jgi:PAS domain S-box-containing protein